MPESGDRWIAEVVGDLGIIAEWNRLVGREDESLLVEDYSITEPKHVRDARGRVMRLVTRDVLPPVEQMEPVDASIPNVAEAAAVIERALEPFDERSIDILRLRVFADDPEGLESIGDRYGVTRERIRQLEVKAKVSLVAAVAAGPLASVRTTLRERAATVRALADVIDRLPAIAEPVPSLGQPVWRVLDRLDDSYEILDGWCASPTVEAAIAATSAQVESMFGEDGFVSYDDVQAAGNVQADESWLRRCGFTLLEGYVMAASGSVNVRAAIVLTVAGEPLDSEAIHSRLGVERSLGSLKNAMSVDPRFVRVDRDSFALTAWGFDNYQSIRQLIGRALEGSGGSMPMARLVDALTAEFSVSPRSVMAYASAPPFQAAGGVVRRVGAAELAAARKPGRKPLERRGNAVVVRTVISGEHLRGSGSQLPAAIIEFLGLDYGDSRDLTSARGPQSVSWKSPQPTLGSIRRFCEGEIVDGASVFLVFGDDARSTCSLRRPLRRRRRHRMPATCAPPSPRSSPTSSRPTTCGPRRRIPETCSSARTRKGSTSSTAGTDARCRATPSCGRSSRRRSSRRSRSSAGCRRSPLRGCRTSTARSRRARSRRRSRSCSCAPCSTCSSSTSPTRSSSGRRARNSTRSSPRASATAARRCDSSTDRYGSPRGARGRAGLR
jgi:hypothetical protein